MQDLNYLHSSFEAQEGLPAKNVEHRDLKTRPIEVYCDMVGASPLMLKLFEEIKESASSCVPILVLGSVGVGKKLVAKALHKVSKSSRPMVSINCQTFPKEMFEEKVLKHVNGSSEVSFFFQRIEEMELPFQDKLLAVVEEKAPESLRWIASAAPGFLQERARQGFFREKLYEYFNHRVIKVPDLKDRKEDICLLAHFFLRRYLQEDTHTSLASRLHQDVISSLVCYDWPGNVRELDNLIERLVVLAGDDPIRPEFLPQKFRIQSQKSPLETSFSLPPEGIDLKKILSRLEDSLIQQALKKTHGNKNKASKLLKINRTTLIEKIKKKGLSKD